MAHINVAGASFTETADKCFWRVLLQGWAVALPDITAAMVKPALLDRIYSMSVIYE